MKRIRYIALGCVALCVLTACTPAVREANSVVAQADSLWRAGMPCGDSIALAQAFTTLDTYQFLYPDDYAHACYHYGRLLREKENPVEAMQCFIHATHSHTRDYHILGRVYSNMGDIAHLAGEYELSYNMYERSGEMYLLNKDSLLYYYDLNNMAFEKAMMVDTTTVFALIDTIENHCVKFDVLTKILETKAEAYYRAMRYDSAISVAKELCSKSDHYPLGVLLQAQIFSIRGQKDSATYYAKQVLCYSSDISDIHNALYILTNDDEEKDKTAIRETAADRADIQREIERRKGKLSQAVQLLQQDLNRKPDWRVYVIIVIIVMSVCSFGVLSTQWKRRKHQMHERVASLADQQANSMIESIKKHIGNSDINNTLHWKDYAAMKTNADLYMGGIVTKLEAYHLNEVEIRFCVLTLLDYRLRIISKILNYSYPSAIKTLKKRISDKLGTTPPELKEFLLHLLPTL